MLSKVHSAGLLGIDGYLVDVEVDIAVGLANWTTVGLPESSVRESRDRVIAAIRNSGYSFERRRITINLAPANVRKEGTGFDLPIALGLLASSELIPGELLKEFLIVGELSLEGAVNPIHGALSLTLLARKKGILKMILPETNLPEASVIPDIELYGVRSLSDVVQHLTGERPLRPASHTTLPTHPTGESAPSLLPDFSDVRGQSQAKRALEVAAAGSHNLLMIGPPGTGKTMIAQRLPGILPEMNLEESIETTRIYSATGLLNGQGPLIRQRPFRSPHHTISGAGLVGGGSYPRPGEVSLAHNGLLFLDEFPEFQKHVLEILRQPIESGEVTIARAETSLTYPARFMLVAAMNPCRCGFRGSPVRDCFCTAKDLHLYRTRLSGPLLDRLDIQIDIPPVKYDELTAKSDGESSARIRERVLKARQIQGDRFRKLRLYVNSQMSGKTLRRFCTLDDGSAALLAKAHATLKLSARAHDRILKVARTIADLEGSEPIRSAHIGEAIHYRSLDRNIS